MVVLGYGSCEANVGVCAELPLVGKDEATLQRGLCGGKVVFRVSWTDQSVFDISPDLKLEPMRAVERPRTLLHRYSIGHLTPVQTY